MVDPHARAGSRMAAQSPTICATAEPPRRRGRPAGFARLPAKPGSRPSPNPRPEKRLANPSASQGGRRRLRGRCRWRRRSKPSARRSMPAAVAASARLLRSRTDRAGNRSAVTSSRIAGARSISPPCSRFGTGNHGSGREQILRRSRTFRAPVRQAAVLCVRSGRDRASRGGPSAPPNCRAGPGFRRIAAPRADQCAGFSVPFPSSAAPSGACASSRAFIRNTL